MAGEQPCPSFGANKLSTFHFGEEIRPGLNSYDTCAAYHVACELLGRREDMPPQQPEQMDWRADWRDLLAELKGELNREQE